MPVCSKGFALIVAMSCCPPHCQFEIFCSLHSTFIPNQPMPVSKDVSVCKPSFFFIQGNMSSSFRIIHISAMFIS
uniref:Secreted protein n=1 Tax=Heterorhabditis bacteriophora TaxID=37862 RepID=A0A1I7WWC6_HETBA